MCISWQVRLLANVVDGLQLERPKQLCTRHWGRRNDGCTTARRKNTEKAWESREQPSGTGVGHDGTVPLPPTVWKSVWRTRRPQRTTTLADHQAISTNLPQDPLQVILQPFIGKTMNTNPPRKRWKSKARLLPASDSQVREDQFFCALCWFVLTDCVDVCTTEKGYRLASPLRPEWKRIQGKSFLERPEAKANSWSAIRILFLLRTCARTNTHSEWRPSIV